MLASTSFSVRLSESLADIGSLVSGGHTNTERGYLDILAPRLVDELKLDPHFRNQIIPITISREDAHPLTIE